ncbi:MAG: preprotein translocase subunit SecG [Arenicella sp.]|nr:preprotein translocase subunit SecG [Arenicella sp.]
MTITILIIVNVFTALSIIVLALMQQSKGDMGAAFGGGSSQSMFGSRGSANFLSRTTALMCVLFFATSLTLAYMYTQRAESESVMDESSVIQQSSEIPNLGDEVPSINGAVEDATSGLPAIEGEESAVEVLEQVDSATGQGQQADESDIPAIPDQ